MLILGIESSCDETGLALYHHENGIIAEKLHSQIEAHAPHGGVVPEIASRDHVRYLVPLLDALMKETPYSLKDISAIAYTQGPGLTGALLTGASFAKALAYGLKIPTIPIHHLEAHLLIAKMMTPDLNFPFLSLLVSGGHTQLIRARRLGEYDVLGDTLDDATGEAFDKTAKLLGLPYPGGKALAMLAETFNPLIHPAIKPFPKPMTDRPGLDFSFSGLKTHALVSWNQSPRDEAHKIAIAHAFQKAIVDTLWIKCNRAFESTGLNTLVIAGGVSANKALRLRLNESKNKIIFPAPEYCTDNGSMIAYAGYLYFTQGLRDKDSSIQVKSRWSIQHASEM